MNLLKCNYESAQPPRAYKRVNHLHQNSLTGSLLLWHVPPAFILFPKGKWSSKAHARWMADLSCNEKDSAGTYNGSPHGNHELAWMRRKPCHREPGPSNSIQMTTSMSPCRNGSNEPVSFRMSRRGKQDMSTGERSTGKQEEDSFPPRGVALAGILRSPLHWFDSQCWSPPPPKKKLLCLMNERQLHKVSCRICL